MSAGAVELDDVGVMGSGGGAGDWIILSLLRVCRDEEEAGDEDFEVATLVAKVGIRPVERRCLNLQAPHSLLLLVFPATSLGCSSAAVSLVLDITGVVLGVG